MQSKSYTSATSKINNLDEVSFRTVLKEVEDMSKALEGHKLMDLMTAKVKEIWGVEMNSRGSKPSSKDILIRYCLYVGFEIIKDEHFKHVNSDEEELKILKELERLLILDSQLHDDEIVDESWELLNHIKKTLVEASKAKRED